MERQTLTDEFLAFECEHDLFEVTVDGVPVWERVRQSIHRDLLRSKDLSGQAHTARSEGLRENLTRLGLLARNTVWRNPLLADEHDSLFFGHQRRKQLDDGRWWDLYCDPIHAESNLDYLQVEIDNNLSHARPARTERLRYLDLLTFTGALRRKAGLVSMDLDGDWQRLREAGHVFRSQFDVEIDLVHRIREQCRIRAGVKPLFRRFVQTVDPAVAVVVVSYAEYRPTFIEVCKELDVPVVELQHGVIHRDHLGYEYPDGRPRATAPDVLLTWGQFWNEAASLPHSEKNVRAVGYPYLERQYERYADLPQSDQIVFVSQGTVGERLSKFAVAVSEANRIDRDVVYKLHPGEYDRWRGEYPWLIDADVEVIDSSSPPLYELFATSGAQVGVGSTAVYEGLCFDLQTFVYDLPGHEILRPLLEEETAQLVSSVEELASGLDSPTGAFDRSKYFTPNAVSNTVDALEDLVD